MAGSLRGREMKSTALTQIGSEAPFASPLMLPNRVRLVVPRAPLAASVVAPGVGNNFALSRGEKLDEQIRDVKRRVDYAQILGAPFVRVFSGGLRNGVALTEMEARSSAVSAL